MKKYQTCHIFLIEHLTYSSFIIGVFMKLCHYQVYFFDAARPFNYSKSIRFCSIIGIQNLSYLDVDYSVKMSGIQKRFDLSEEVFQKTFATNSLYHQIVEYFRFDQKGIRKLNCVLRFLLNNETSSNGPVLIELAEYALREKNAIKFVYLPNSIASYLMISHIENNSIFAIAWYPLSQECMAVVNKGFSVLWRKFIGAFHTRFNQKRANDNPESIVNDVDSRSIQKDFSQYEIAFFPHKNIQYGPFFQKTYLYEDNIDSPLYYQKVLTLFRQETDQVSAQYFDEHTIPFLSINSLINMKELIAQTVIFFHALNKVQIIRDALSINHLLSTIFLTKFSLFYLKEQGIIEQFVNLKIVYIHYDILFSQPLVLACHQNGVQTISMQERPNSYNFYFDLCYEHYLIWGKGFIPKLKEKRYVADYLYSVGVVRSAYISQPQDIAYDKYIDIKKTHKLVVCYGLFPVDTFSAGIAGNVGTSDSSNLDFLQVLLHLAIAFPGVYLVIRFKDTAHLQRTLYREIIEQIARQPNIEITSDLEQQNSYKMVYLADLIIGKWTSIMEEAFAAGKDIIYYDKENFIITLDLVLTELAIIACNYDELHAKIKMFLSGEPYFDHDRADEIRSLYYKGEHGQEPGFEIIRQYVKGLL